MFFREVSRFHRLPEFIESDQNNTFINTFWHELCILASIELTPSSLFPLVEYIQKWESKTWFIWIPLVIGVAQQESVGIRDGGILNWLWDMGSHMIFSLIHILILLGRVVSMVGLFHFLIVMKRDVENYSIG